MLRDSKASTSAESFSIRYGVLIGEPWIMLWSNAFDNMVYFHADINRSVLCRASTWSRRALFLGSAPGNVGFGYGFCFGDLAPGSWAAAR